MKCVFAGRISGMLFHYLTILKLHIIIWNNQNSELNSIFRILKFEQKHMTNCEAFMQKKSLMNLRLKIVGIYGIVT